METITIQKNELPKGWLKKPIGDLVTKVSSGSTPKGGRKNYLKQGDIYFLRSQNIHNNKYGGH